MKKLTITPKENPEGKAYHSVDYGTINAGLVTEMGGKFLVVVCGLSGTPGNLWAPTLWGAVELIVDCHEAAAVPSEIEEAA